MDTVHDASHSSRVGLGVMTVVMLHLLQVPLGFCCGLFGAYAFLWPPLIIGVSQFVYVGPVLWLARRKGRVDEYKGLWIGAGITVLLNAACWGALWIPAL